MSLADLALLPPAAAYALVVLFGLLVGSFLNVVILRLPPRLLWSWRGEARELLELPAASEPPPPGIVRRASHCPHCGHALAWYENLPLLSWIALRGRCSACQAPISVQYPLIELLTALGFAACLWRFGPGLELLAALAFMALLIALSGIDWRTRYLPDGLTYPLLWLGLLASLVGPEGLFVPPGQAILGAVVGYLSLWTVYQGFKLATGKEGMGHGDFKLLAALGAWCGLVAILPIVLLSSLLGALIGAGLLALKGQDRATPIPFGPFLAIAGVIWFLFGDPLLAAYWALMLPTVA